MHRDKTQIRDSRGVKSPELSGVGDEQKRSSGPPLQTTLRVTAALRRVYQTGHQSLHVRSRNREMGVVLLLLKSFISFHEQNPGYVRKGGTVQATRGK